LERAMTRTSVDVGTPGFVVDHQSMRLNSGRQIDWAHVGEIYRTTPGTPPVSVVVGVAGAAADATSVPVAALSAAIPSGTVLSFGGQKFARLTAIAALGATALTVAALPKALVSGDTATYAGTVGSGPKVLKAGTVVGELLGSGKVSPRVVTTNPATGILVATAIQDDRSAALSGYGVYNGGNVYEALLPDASGDPRVLASAIKTELATAGCTFQYEVYADDTAS
jgi:hypothetical protein